MSATETEGTSGSDTEEFSIEDLEKMASEQEAPAKKPKPTKRKATKPAPDSDSDDDDNDDEDVQGKPKKKAKADPGLKPKPSPKKKPATKVIEAPVKERPKPSPQRRVPAKIVAVDLDGKERSLPKTTTVIRSPDSPLTYKEFLRRTGEGTLTEEGLAEVAKGITIFKQRTSQQPRILWGFNEAIFPERKYTVPVKKTEVLKLVQQFYDAAEPELRPVPFSEFEPAIEDGANPGKAPKDQMSAAERAVLDGTGYGMPATAPVKRRPAVAQAVVVQTATQVERQEPDVLSLQRLAQFANSAKAKITISFGHD
jgi:hypothetical protein